MAARLNCFDKRRKLGISPTFYPTLVVADPLLSHTEVYKIDEADTSRIGGRKVHMDGAIEVRNLDDCHILGCCFRIALGGDPNFKNCVLEKGDLFAR